MKTEPNIIILAGGVGAERDISLLSGRALFESLSPHFTTKLIDLTKRSLPSGISANSDIIFPIIHGEFGEDGELQALDTRGIEYCGSAVRMQVVYVCTNLRPKKECPVMEFECRGINFTTHPS